MITGIGIDIVDRNRFNTVPDKPQFLRQVFTDKELRARSVSPLGASWAAYFAIKEAVMKAFWCGLHLGSYWHDIEIRENGTVAVSGIFTRCVKPTTAIHIARCSSKHHTLGCALVQE